MIRPRCVILEKYNFMENWVPIVLIYEGLYNNGEIKERLQLLSTYSRYN